MAEPAERLQVAVSLALHLVEFTRLGHWRMGN